jgi:Rieske Fe-S protein
MWHKQPPADACGECGLAPSRRDFVRRLTLALSGAFASIGVSRRAAAALPVSFLAPQTAAPPSHSYPVPPSDGVQIDRKSEVILVRWDHAVYAFNLACPHQNVALRWNEKDRRFKCPKHNSRYEPDGTFVDGRATRGLDRFSIALDGSNVVVDVATMHKQDADPTGWAAAVLRLPPGHQ